MTDVDDHGRPVPPLAAGEIARLLGFLDYQRATLAWKCGGLDKVGLEAKVGGSSITLGGLLRHLAWIEEFWFSLRLHGNDPAPRWFRKDWDADPLWDWHPGAEATPEQLHDFWQYAVARSRTLVAEALADGDPDRPARVP